MQEREERVSEDDEIVQAVNDYTRALQDGLRIVNTTWDSAVLGYEHAWAIGPMLAWLPDGELFGTARKALAPGVLIGALLGMMRGWPANGCWVEAVGAWLLPERQ
jgi:SF-assemblin/beta giardin